MKVYVAYIEHVIGFVQIIFFGISSGMELKEGNENIIQILYPN